MALSKAYWTTGKIFEQVSIRNSPGLVQQLKALEPGEIVVVRGTYDHVETLLDTTKIPYTLIEPSAIKTNNGGRVLLVNCATYTSAPKTSIEEFVNQGGRLVTTDWALGLVSKVFPKKLTQVGKTTDDVVEVQCGTDLARRLMGLNYAQCHPKWWLEGSSDVYDLGQGVTPLITSEELQEKYGKPYIAAGFTHGKGEVIHFISHLELQRTRLSTKQDKEGLEVFLKKMQASKTADMEDATVAELEAAYSTLNTVAYLCAKTPLLDTSMKSVMPLSKTGSAEKSKRLV